MDEIYIRKEFLTSWIKKYFKDELISVDDLISCIEDLDCEIDDLKEQLEDMQRDIEDNYKPIRKSEQYDVNECDFI